MHQKIPYIFLAIGIVLVLSTTGCVQLDEPSDAFLLMEFSDQGNIQVENITSYAVSEAHRLGVNFPETERMV
ncbi:hypothetical protein O0S10_07130 [Methanocorpusculum sp. MG]|uniref:Uncharacterized protein n=1 Tax=Methanocorpusculum petauri TaxID=3002863 RepID=A0ABT4IIB5_9EURY|nr:hypothetical protein [Methanocorpusculum petauri]MCZ0860997.1 hypothetical protein [Methanocorpusculum petauri]